MVSLSLPVPCGLMPRTRPSPRPSCPMVQLIICSATRKLMLPYASLCLQICGVLRPHKLAWYKMLWLWFEDPLNLMWYPSYTLWPCPVSECPTVGMLTLSGQRPSRHYSLVDTDLFFGLASWALSTNHTVTMSLYQLQKSLLLHSTLASYR